MDVFLLLVKRGRTLNLLTRGITLLYKVYNSKNEVELTKIRKKLYTFKELKKEAKGKNQMIGTLTVYGRKIILRDCW